MVVPRGALPVGLLAIILAVGALGRASAQACDPNDPNLALDFLDLAPLLGQIVCKAGPGVNMTDALLKLTAPAANLRPDQLDRLPGLISTLIIIPPGAIQPFLKLTPEQLEKALPILTKIPTNKLAGIFQLLAGLPDQTTTNLLTLLNLIPQSQLERLVPAFERLTPEGTEIIRKALRIIPANGWDFLIVVVRKLMPVTDYAVAPAITKLPTIKIEDSKYTIPDVQPPNTAEISRKYYQDAADKAKGCPNCSEGDATNASLDVATALTEDIGPLVCKFGVDKLKDTLNKTLTVVAAQCPETLRNLPQLASTLASVPPRTLDVFLRIPEQVLRELIPVVIQLPSNKVEFLLNSLVGQSSEDINKLIFFVNAVPYKNIVSLVPFFSKINDQQTRTVAKLLNALSPGQIILTIRLLDKFGFSLNAIGDLAGITLDTYDQVVGKNPDGSVNQAAKSQSSRTVRIPVREPKKGPSQISVAVGAPEPWKPSPKAVTVTSSAPSSSAVTYNYSTGRWEATKSVKGHK